MGLDMYLNNVWSGGHEQIRDAYEKIYEISEKFFKDGEWFEYSCCW